MSNPQLRLPFFFVLILAALVFISGPAAAQRSLADENFTCGSNVTKEEVQRYMQQLIDNPLPPAPTTPTTYCVGIAAHIVRTSAGTGGLSISQYLQGINDSNFYWASTGIQFYTQSLDYIDSDYYYNEVSGPKINELRTENVVPNRINVYFTPNLPGLCGISSFTFSSSQGIVMANGCTGTASSPSVLAHEIGHYFNLYHTHETAFGAELVNGSNCGTAGDQICDTPADPLLGYANVTVPGCAYVGSSTDSNGDTYVPDPSQIMSYSPSVCAIDFSAQSETKAVTTLLGPRSNHLLGCPTGAPVVDTATPALGFVDQTLDVVLAGSNFGLFSWAKFGSGITVNSVDTVTTDTLVVNISIAPGASEGFRNVIVTQNLLSDTLLSAFEVRGTPIHYVAGNGANVYPYGQPSDAAHSLSNAYAAAGLNDSVLVDTTSINGVTLGINKALVISGGWLPDFSSRSGRTRLDLNTSISISSVTVGSPVLDGFIMEGGLGVVASSPVSGRYGGGMYIINTNATLINCEIRNNTTFPLLGYGGGGGIFVNGSNVTITDCEFHNNETVVGGGLYMYNSTGTLSGNTFSANELKTGGASQLKGGGVLLEKCTGVVMTDNVYDGAGTGAANGGGLMMIDSDATISGGNMDNNAVTSGGGAATLTGSTVSFDGVSFSGNSATIFGGAISTDDSTSLTVSNCEFHTNTAIIGGAVYHNGGSGDIRHNLFVDNTGSSSGGALYVQSALGGSIYGNTIDDNTSGTTAGIGLSNAPILVFNNLVTNSTGGGINCTGTAPTLSYNNVWNSSGADYSGCSGPAGSDPLYLNAGGGDYHLTLNSPAIDAGDPSGAYDDPDGSRGDIGRYGSHTFVMDQPSYAKNLMSDNSGSTVILTWSPNPEGDIDYYAIHCDTISGFIPSAANLLTTTPDTTYDAGSPADTLYYVVSAVDLGGYAGGYSDEVTSDPPTTTAAGDPVSYVNGLSQNVPNPFNPTTTIHFSIAATSRVSLIVYDVSGRRVRTLVDGTRGPSEYSQRWNGTNDSGQRVSSGVYFYRLVAGNFAETRKMVLLK